MTCKKLGAKIFVPSQETKEHLSSSAIYNTPIYVCNQWKFVSKHGSFGFHKTHDISTRSLYLLMNSKMR